MPDCQSNAQRSAGVTGRRLNPNIFERSFAHDAAVSDAVQRHAAGHAQPLHVRFLVNMLDHLEHDFLCDCLYAARQIHLTLRYFCFRLAWATFVEMVDGAICPSWAL